MENTLFNTQLFKIIYLILVLSIVYKNTEKIIPQITQNIPSLNTITENISKNRIPNPNTLYKNFCNKINKYIIIFFISFLISSILFYLTYKIIHFLRNSHNNCYDIENTDNSDILSKIELKINKIKNNDNNENKVENDIKQNKIENEIKNEINETISEEIQEIINDLTDKENKTF